MSYCLTEENTNRKVTIVAMSKHNVSYPSTTSGDMGQWSSGYDVALTTRRPPVQFRPGPYISLGGVPVETEVFWPFVGFTVFSSSKPSWNFRTRRTQSYGACW